MPRSEIIPSETEFIDTLLTGVLVRLRVRNRGRKQCSGRIVRIDFFHGAVLITDKANAAEIIPYKMAILAILKGIVSRCCLKHLRDRVTIYHTVEIVLADILLARFLNSKRKFPPFSIPAI